MNKKRVWLVLLLLLGGMLGYKFWPAADAEKKSVELFAMDTYMTMTAYGAPADAALNDASRRLKEIESLLSVTDQNSEIYAINHRREDAVTVSPATSALLTFALHMAQATNGALDPTIYPVLRAWGFTTSHYQIPSPSALAELLAEIGYQKVTIANNVVQLPRGMQLDLGAVGKGYAADEVARILKDHGIKAGLLDLGGNILAIGHKPDGSKWRIGIKAPREAGNLGELRIADRSVVTSGDYERYFIGDDGKRYHHIINPKNGLPADNGLMAVTVIGDESIRCDALSTALFVMGLTKAEAYWQANQDFDLILIDAGGTIYLTPGIKDDFILNETHQSMAVRVIKKAAN